MDNLHIIGNPNRKRKLIYDPNLADRINKETEAEIRRKELEEKLKKKKQPKESTIINPPSIAVPSNMQYSFLEGDFGKQILEEYNSIVKNSYNDNPKLKILNWNEDKKVVTGSNAFANILINQILEKQNSKYRIAKLSDLEQTIRGGDILKIKGNHYVDLSLALRSGENPNEYLAKDLIKQIKLEIRKELEFSYMLHLQDLDLINEGNSDYGLAFKLKDNAEIIHSEILNKLGYFDQEESDKNTGLPKETYQERTQVRNRYLYTRDSGLVRLYLNRGLSINSDYEDFAYSDAYGRVVVVRATGTPQNSSGGN